MQQVEIDRATIITSAEKGSPRMTFSADFYQIIAIATIQIAALTVASTKPSPRLTL